MPFIPLDDDTPRTFIRWPYVNWALILACVAVYYWQSQAGVRAGVALVYGLGVIPITVNGGAELPPELYLISPFATLVTYMFLHGSLMHLLGNMLFLWVFGDNVEDSMGHVRYLLFYVVCGALAAVSQVLVFPDSDMPMIGASGAVSGVLGAYLLLHPKARVLVPIFFIPIRLPAWFLLIGWFALQSYAAFTDATGGVAWWAHVGGFLAGLFLIPLFRRRTVPLFGASDLPSGITLRDRARWARHQRPDGRRWRGPWG